LLCLGAQREEVSVSERGLSALGGRVKVGAGGFVLPPSAWEEKQKRGQKEGSCVYDAAIRYSRTNNNKGKVTPSSIFAK